MRPVLYTSIPKCGTHLLRRYFQASGFAFVGPHPAPRWDPAFIDLVGSLRDSEYAAWHYEWTPELSGLLSERGIRAVFLYRDPRAQLVSNLHWAMKMPAHPAHAFLTGQLHSDDERLLALIRGVSEDVLARFFPPNLPIQHPRELDGSLPGFRRSITRQFLVYTGWLDDPQCLCVKYEDAVGLNGGGSRERQVETVRRLIEHTGASPGLSAEEIADGLYSRDDVTFRSGRIDSWRNEFSAEVTAAFLEEAGDLLPLFGYEP